MTIDNQVPKSRRKERVVEYASRKGRSLSHARQWTWRDSGDAEFKKFRLDSNKRDKAGATRNYIFWPL